MKALTLTEPWASLVAIGAKRVDTRSWPTNYRGPIAIHAGKGMSRDDVRFTRDAPMLLTSPEEHLEKAGIAPMTDFNRVYCAFPKTRGRVVATATMAGCLKIAEIVGQDEGTFEDPTGHWYINVEQVGKLLFPLDRRVDGEHAPLLSVWNHQYVPPTLRLVISEEERHYGIYEPGRFLWLFTDMQRLAEPIPAVGAQGLWNWEPPAELAGAT